MSPTKQNLFLFFEENELQYIIDRKLVLLYANRCIIDEDTQFEICGVYELQRVTEPMINSNSLYKNNAIQRTYKEAKDRDLISDAYEKACLNESNSMDTHFIIGSSFYTREDFKFWPTVPNMPRKIKEWMLDELKGQELKKVYVSLLTGYRIGVISKEMSKAGKMNHLEFGWKNEPFNPKCSVNDDFELSISLMRHGRRLQEQMHLFLHPNITAHQLTLIKTKDESYLRSFTNIQTGRRVTFEKGPQH